MLSPNIKTPITPAGYGMKGKRKMKKGRRMSGGRSMRGKY